MILFKAYFRVPRHESYNMGKKIVDISGKRYNRLNVLSFNSIINNKAYFKCQCDCGCFKIILGYNITHGFTKSCGCLKREVSKKQTKQLAKLNINNLINKRFHRLLVFERAKNPNPIKNRGAYWKCKCDCGNIVVIRSSSLVENKTKSCGCYNIERFIERTMTHGKYGLSEYNSWSGMKDRCYNKNNLHYQRYGGRGIRVCKKWKYSFENFYNDMGPKPSKLYSLDRINNNKGYSKENCRWATKLEQVKNRNSVRLITFNGLTLNLKDWSRKITYNKNSNLIYGRIYNGWSDIKAVSTQYIPRKKR